MELVIIYIVSLFLPSV